MNINGKVVVITGGASGLGEAAGRYLVDRGARFGIIDVNADRGNAIVAELGEDKAFFAQADVTDISQVDSAIEAIVAKFGRIDIDVNAAGVPGVVKVLDREGKASGRETYSKIIDLNLKGVFNVASRAAEEMAKNDPDENWERGVIVNVSSGAAEAGQIGQVAYSSSKAGVNGLNMPAARELVRHGIRIGSIMPGLFKTPLVAQQPEEFIAGLAAQVESPKRLGDPTEFAHAVTFIIENGYYNGRTMQLDAATILRAR